MRVIMMNGTPILTAVLLLPLITYGQKNLEEITGDQILQTDDRWQAIYDAYQPPADLVKDLKTGLGTGAKIDVYLGLWCPDSRRNLPPFLKIIDLLASDVTVRYFSVPRKASRQIEYYVEELKVTRVPTFIVYRDGDEIGRIKENPNVGMLEDLLEIVGP